MHSPPIQIALECQFGEVQAFPLLTGSHTIPVVALLRNYQVLACSCCLLNMLIERAINVMAHSSKWVGKKIDLYQETVLTCVILFSR